MKRAIPRLAMLLALASTVASIIPATGAAALPATGSWSIQAVPSPAGASNVALNGISCPARTLCIAVGGSSLGALAEEWNGTAWSIQAAPSPASTDVLSSVSCASATACEAVGSTGAGALAEAWNGTSWTVQPTPPGSIASLASVWCTSAKQCTAVGYNDNGPIAEGWNGSDWARQPGLPPPHMPPSRRLAALYGVWCSSARSCTGAGNAFIIPGPPLLATTSWNGTKWSWSGMYDTAGLLNGVSCSAKVCIAVGQSASPIPRQHVPAPLSLNNPGDGGGTVMAPPTPKGFGAGTLSAVSCRVAVCEAVGSTNLGTLAERWTGTKWSRQPTPNPTAGLGALTGIACTSPTACIAVGTAAGTPLAEAYASAG